MFLSCLRLRCREPLGSLSAMLAALFHEHGGPEVIQVARVPEPEPGPGEVRVRVRATALNHLDLWVRRGLPVRTPLPHIGGSDIAGEVDLPGPGVAAIRPGTRVVVDPSLDYQWYGGIASGPSLPAPEFRILGEHLPGGMAEYVIVPSRNLVEIPDEVSFETAAAASLAAVTAYRAVFCRGKAQVGERVLVTGASGGVATMAIQMAKLAGARVYAVTSGPDNVERVRALGADVVYDRLEVEAPVEVWRETRKEGVDVIIDSVGGDQWNAWVRSLAPGGRVVCYGATAGPRVETDLRLLFWKQASLLGTTMGSPREYREAMHLVFDGAVKPVIHAILPLAEARRAHELLEAGAVFGKVVLRP
jgi:NADPH:quinone reductase-like Zn-dependent oxidoreductase